MFLAVVAQHAHRAKQYISPRIVLAAAPLTMRLQFWGLVIFGVFLASVQVAAQKGDSVPPASWMTSWQFIALLVTWAFGTGGVLARLTGVKDALLEKIASEREERLKLEHRLNFVESSTVKQDKLNDKLETIAEQIKAVHQLIAADRQWRDGHHGGKE